jgi:four helix bundle protein
MEIARRVASETEYWLQLLLQADYISEKAFNSIETDRLEIFKMLTSIVKTSKENE